MKYLLPAVLLTVGTAAFAINLPDGLYIHSGNSTMSYRPVNPTNGADAIPRPNSPSRLNNSKVCIRNGQAWLDAQIRKHTVGLFPASRFFPAGRFEERPTDKGRVFTLLNPAEAKSGLQSYTFSMAEETDRQGRPRLYFAFHYHYTEDDTAYESHGNGWYTYQGKDCPADAKEE